MEQAVDRDTIASLRQRGVISENEIVVQVGDIYVAHNVLTQGRRRLEGIDTLINESSKRLLKG